MRCSRGNFSTLYLKLFIHFHEAMCEFETNTILKGTITWSTMVQETNKVKEFYSDESRTVVMLVVSV